MPWVDIPLPKLNYPSADSSELPQEVGGRMVDMFIDNLGNYRSRPKLEEFVDLGTAAAVDGIFWSENREFALAVSGGSIFKLVHAGNPVDVTGDALTAGKKVIFDEDGTTIVMANGGRMVTYADPGATAFMADADAPIEVNHVAFLDGYMLANKLDTKRFPFSDPTNILSWAVLDFFSAEGRPDNLEAVFVTEREIALFGRQSIEWWWNDGSPFSRIETAFSDSGVGAVASIVQTDDEQYLLLTDKRRVKIFKGRNSQDISAPVDSIIKKLVFPREGRGMFIKIGEQSFYVLAFPDDNKTIVVDLASGTWAEWGEWNVPNGSYDMFRGISYAFADKWDFHLIGDRNNGKIYKLSFDNTDDDGNTVRSLLRTGPIVHGSYNEKRCNAIKIRMKRSRGTGVTEPKIALRWRDDGLEWSNEIDVSLGKEGDSDYFALVTELGSYTSREWEFIHTFDTDFTLVNVKEDVEVLAH